MAQTANDDEDDDDDDDDDADDVDANVGLWPQNGEHGQKRQQYDQRKLCNTNIDMWPLNVCNDMQCENTDYLSLRPSKPERLL